MFWEGLSLLRDKVGEGHLSGRPGCLLGSWVLTLSLPSQAV